jgi:hypothetical protein
MAIEKTWSIAKMDCLSEAAGVHNVVSAIQWRLTGTDGINSCEIIGGINAPINFDEPLVPYSDLTEELVIGWVKDTMGAEQVASYESAIDKHIADIVNPPIVSNPLPWN